MENKEKCFIIQCSHKKLDYSCEAKELYQGINFKKIYNLIQPYKFDIYILSAKYGLIKSTDIIEPYNLTLETVPPGYTKLYSEEYKKEYKEKGLKNQNILIPVLKQQINVLEKYNEIYTIFSKTYKNTYLKSGGDKFKL